MCGFREEYAVQNLQFDQIQNGQLGLSAIIDYRVHNIWKTMPDG